MFQDSCSACLLVSDPLRCQCYQIRLYGMCLRERLVGRFSLMIMFHLS